MTEVSNDRSHVPKWDGNPQGYQRYKDEIRIWRLSENMNVDFSLAARMIGALSGSARRATISLPEEVLMPDVPDEPASTLRARKNRKGVDNVLEKLKEIVHEGKVQLKAQSLNEFFSTPSKYDRRPAERITDWITRFDEGEMRLSEHGVDLARLEDVRGWFFLKKAKLDMRSKNNEREERVLAALTSDEFPLAVLKPMFIRMFGSIHLTERSDPRHYASRSLKFRPDSRRLKHRPVNIIEDEPEASEPDDLAEGEDDDELLQPEELQDVMRNELEGLTQDLEEHDLDLEEVLGADQAVALEGAALELSNVAESLSVVRNARSALRDSSTAKGRGRNARGRSQSKGRGKSRSSDSSSPAVASQASRKPRGGSLKSTKSLQKRIQDRKKGL